MHTFGELAAAAHARGGVTLLALRAAGDGAPRVNPRGDTPLAPGDVVWGVGASLACACALLASRLPWRTAD
jgi:hypothetical protein